MEESKQTPTPATATTPAKEPKATAPILTEEAKAIFRQMHPERNTFTFTGKGGIIISSDFDSGNLAACE